MPCWKINETQVSHTSTKEIVLESHHSFRQTGTGDAVTPQKKNHPKEGHKGKSENNQQSEKLHVLTHILSPDFTRNSRGKDCWFHRSVT